jgi:hypothetical protein
MLAVDPPLLDLRARRTPVALVTARSALARLTLRPARREQLPTFTGANAWIVAHRQERLAAENDNIEPRIFRLHIVDPADVKRPPVDAVSSVLIDKYVRFLAD